MKHRTIQGKKQDTTSFNARIELDVRQNRIRIIPDPKEEGLFYSVLAKQIVNATIGRRPRARKPRLTLKKPRVKRNGGRTVRRGPNVHYSKDLDFSKEEIRRRETRKLIRKMAKKRRLTVREMAVRIQFNDFRKNGLGLIMNHHDNHPYRAVVEAYPKWNLQPWEMKRSPVNIWKIKENRVAATDYVLRRSRKKPGNLTRTDFKEAGLGKLTNKFSLYSLLVDAGYAYSPKEIRAQAKSGMFGQEKLYPWQLYKIPNLFWDSASNRKNATRWLVCTQKDPGVIGTEDFIDRGIGGVLTYHYKNKKGGIREALKEAGFRA